MNRIGATTECVKINEQYKATVCVSRCKDRFQSGFELACGEIHISKCLVTDMSASSRDARASAWSAVHEELSLLASAHSGGTSEDIIHMGKLALKVEELMREIKERQMQLFEVPSDAS